MVAQSKETKNLFKCDECGFFYRDFSVAKRCEDWCKKYKSCNIEITKFAVKG
ncbi:hypothetical protein HYV84_03730 [Candidatus Woesearchaeota archaeon]|nr:hypothetical protein [Candidatus Woesearchaeota archaeon]